MQRFDDENDQKLHYCRLFHVFEHDTVQTLEEAEYLWHTDGYVHGPDPLDYVTVLQTNCGVLGS